MTSGLDLQAKAVCCDNLRDGFFVSAQVEEALQHPLAAATWSNKWCLDCRMQLSLAGPSYRFAIFSNLTAIAPLRRARMQSVPHLLRHARKFRKTRRSSTRRAFWSEKKFGFQVPRASSIWTSLQSATQRGKGRFPFSRHQPFTGCGVRGVSHRSRGALKKANYLSSGLRHRRAAKAIKAEPCVRCERSD